MDNKMSLLSDFLLTPQQAAYAAGFGAFWTVLNYIVMSVPLGD